MGTQTKLEVRNDTNADVVVYLTLGATPGCVRNVREIPFVAHVIHSLQGWFVLKSKESVSYTPPEGVGINGNFAFGTPPLNCPTTEFVWGVNLAEFILNNGFQGAGAQETIDISAVAGTNCTIRFEMSGGGVWNAGSTYPVVNHFENKFLGKNVGQVGVYPYGCDGCTASISPPVCATPPVGAPNPPVPQKEAICNVQRDASNSGGNVVAIFKGIYQVT